MRGAAIGARHHSNPGPRRIRWANLLSRVFKVDVSICPKWYVLMRMLDAVIDPANLPSESLGLGWLNVT